jgi:hypothetical protein
MSGMFRNCRTLTTVPLLNMVAAINVSNMFNGCSSLTRLPALNLAAVSSSANAGGFITNCLSLSSAAFTGLRFTFSVASCRLSATALNQIYTNLPTVTGQTITVTGNYGTTGDTPSIATAKGWTVSG